ncbi:hypothetical protein PLICRDRAFT_37628 [Plicaturopsis crispa FD-325 SS-3]|nr:hypothetical protein PLICRDRAFT_37628 [Plicaturopsis crispa FD-325 SS-3]
MSSGALLQRAEACRQAALDEEKERDTFEELRKQAMAAGRKKDAFLLKKEWDEADGRARVLHAKADERHFRARNVPSDLENIDLRYLSIPEARRRLEARVRDVLAQDGTRIRVRVGGGTGNTIDKAYVLTHALVEAMSDHHIQAEADRDDRQYVVVTLPSS